MVYIKEIDDDFVQSIKEWQKVSEKVLIKVNEILRLEKRLWWAKTTTIPHEDRTMKYDSLMSNSFRDKHVLHVSNSISLRLYFDFYYVQCCDQFRYFNSVTSHMFDILLKSQCELV